MDTFKEERERERGGGGGYCGKVVHLDVRV